MKKLIFAAVFVLAALAFALWGKLNTPAPSAPKKDQPIAGSSSLPVTHVKRGDVVITITAKGELAGGNSEMLTAPMTGATDMAIIEMRRPGELVKDGDVIVQFDTTDQIFNLKEAEADLAEAEQQVIQAKAESEAKEEEARSALRQAEADVKVAQLETRRNPLVAAIVAKQNDLALAAAQDRLRQLQQDVGNRKATSAASIAIQEAARNKAKVKADTARRNIENMTLRAHREGYVNIQQNTNGDFMFWGMQLPMLQVGDTVRAGMAVAQIPDLKNWEVVARIAELDRGHLSPGQKAEIRVIALPGKTLTGKVKDLGSTGGPPWDRRFDCKVSVEDPLAEMRPGMSTRIIITTDTLKNVLWVPSQALFESDGRSFVYEQTPAGFVPHDVKLVQRSESQVVITGIAEGQTVSLANPDEMTKKTNAPSSATKAISK